MNDEIAAALEQMYGDDGMSTEDVAAIIGQSLHPRSADMLFDTAAALGLHSDWRVLDIGCRDARYSLELARRCGCSVLGVDPVQHNVAKAQRSIAASDQRAQVTVAQGGIEAIPAPDAHFDLIWCRDMLNHVPNLPVAFAECARVLKPGGHMLIYQTFATELLEPQEAARLYPPLVIVPQNMAHSYVEQALEQAGLQIAITDIIASEWREHWEEDGTRTTSQQLLALARLRRNRAQLVGMLGLAIYELELANCHWGVYQMLGKLCPRVYVAHKAQA